MTTASCTFCGKTGITYPHYCDNVDAPIDAPPEVEQPCTAPSRCVVHTPNRFDPYEALEIIDRANFGPLDMDESLKLVHEQVGLLRAYITGMER